MMRPALELTSVPRWAVTATNPDADLSGRQWTVVAFGHGTADVVARWSDQIASHHGLAAARVHWVDDDEAARAAVDQDLAGAVVGWRLMMAGPADACLRLRAHALAAGLGDDEITVASTDVATRDVRCVHCNAVTATSAALEDVVGCTGCGRNLLVYYHVSRRLGAHLGFMIDAEEPAQAVAS
jgi:dimethylamine monooxygenase subunit C